MTQRGRCLHARQHRYPNQPTSTVTLLRASRRAKRGNIRALARPQSREPRPQSAMRGYICAPALVLKNVSRPPRPPGARGAHKNLHSLLA
eukprot:2275964-Pyramimonas_sp.AAC.1